MLILGQLLYQKSLQLIFLTFFNKKLLKFVIYVATVKLSYQLSLIKTRAKVILNGLYLHFFSRAVLFTEHPCYTV